MGGWINARIEKASWASFAVWLALSAVFNYWAFGTSSPWTRALGAGGGKLPETQAGFPPIEPQRSLDALGENTIDYIMWQAFDVPYAILNVMVISIAIGLALKATKLSASPLRLLLVLPVIYFLFELVENTVVALFAGRWLAVSEPAVLVQQLATTIKLVSGFGSMALGLISLVVAVLAALISLVRKKA